ncbi:unnamed protein product [Prunus armeniaca]
MLKMAGFPPNLNDGERWLPSDIFLNEVANSTSKLNPHHFLSMDELAQHLAALSFLRQRQCLSKSLLHIPMEPFRPPVQYNQLGSLPQRSLNLSLSHGLEEKGASFHGYGAELHYHNQFLKPAQLQVCSFLETRKRVLNRQQNRLWTYQGSGIGSMGGFERVSGGTGVFHPRVLNTTTTTRNPQVKKKQGLRNIQQIKATQQRKPIESVGMGRGDCYNQLRSDVRLPQEWTY